MIRHALILEKFDRIRKWERETGSFRPAGKDIYAE